ncbi:MFS transporter [Sphingobium sp.]|uniref:MFS transporter n=1 Tax=Sphingobium sp. TaxID=1912891 RepID=UPI0028BEA869|nr:MFS transporter [Sphingobium sp.]
MSVRSVPPYAPADRAGATGQLTRSALSWALYQGFRDPYLGLVGGFIFMPYFATVLVSDAVAGQAAVATIGKISGLAIAVIAPILGAMVDMIGPRKPLLAALTMLVVPLIACLWFAAPGNAGLPISVVMAILVAVGVLYTMSEVVFASMLPAAVQPSQRSAASGLALSLGNGTSFLLTALVLWAFALPGSVHGFGIPDAPLLGLDPLAHEPSRIVAPIVALSFAIGAIPLFLFARDTPRATARGAATIRDAVANLAGLFREARRHRDVMTYMVVRTVSQDAGTVLLTIGGVYTAGVMRWGTIEMLVYGLFGTVAGMGAGALASWLDKALGPKRALQIEIAGTLITLLGMLGTSATQILYLWRFSEGDVPALWDSPIFATAPEIVYLTIAFVGFLFQIAAWSSARTLLVRLAPPDKVGAFFGLSAFTAATTGWIGPMLVGFFTAAYSSQRAGLVPVAILLLIGWAGLFLVRGGTTEQVSKPR